MSHTLQLILIEADTAEDAMTLVRSHLSNEEGRPVPSWSDWNSSSYASLSFTGEAHFFKTASADDYDCLRYSDDPALAEKTINDFVERRMANLSDLRHKISLTPIDLESIEYDPYSDEMVGMGAWYYERLAEIVQDDWTTASAVYDLETWTASLRYWKKRIELAPERQFIVPVDFHF